MSAFCVGALMIAKRGNCVVAVQDNFTLLCAEAIGKFCIVANVSSLQSTQEGVIHLGAFECGLSEATALRADAAMSRRGDWSFFGEL